MNDLNKVKGFRVACNITQEEMAKALGISDRTYGKLEANPSNFTLEQMNKYIAKINEVNKTVVLADIFLD